MRSVKLDTKGRVVGVCTGPPREGWIELPYHIRDPQLRRFDGKHWHYLTIEERQERDHDHNPPPAEHPARRRLRDLRKRGVTDPAQLADAILDALDTL